MGAGASAAIEDFGAFGDINAIKSLCVQLEKEFDQVKFDLLKDEDGFVTKEQLQELLASANSLSEPLIAEDAAEEVSGPKNIFLAQLKDTVASSIAKGLTPLVVDNSDNHFADTFYQYNAIMVDAKQLSLDVAMKKMKEEDALEKARKGLVSALQNGRTMVVSMQQGSPSFNTWFDSPAEWPMSAIIKSAGKPLTVQDAESKEFGAGVAKAVMRDEDMARHSGFAVVDPNFEIVFTTWFSPDDYEEFLFDEGRALSNCSKELFQVIVIKPEE